MFNLKQPPLAHPSSQSWLDLIHYLLQTLLRFFREGHDPLAHDSWIARQQWVRVIHYLVGQQFTFKTDTSVRFKSHAPGLNLWSRSFFLVASTSFAWGHFPSPLGVSSSWALPWLRTGEPCSDVIDSSVCIFKPWLSRDSSLPLQLNLGSVSWLDCCWLDKLSKQQYRSDSSDTRWRRTYFTVRSGTKSSVVYENSAQLLNSILKIRWGKLVMFEQSVNDISRFRRLSFGQSRMIPDATDGSVRRTYLSWLPGKSRTTGQELCSKVNNFAFQMV